MKDRGNLASNFLYPSSKITYIENKTQFKLIKDRNSKRVISLLKKTDPVTLHKS